MKTLSAFAAKRGQEEPNSHEGVVSHASHNIVWMWTSTGKDRRTGAPRLRTESPRMLRCGRSSLSAHVRMKSHRRNTRTCVDIEVVLKTLVLSCTRCISTNL
jgi:hypothetical protein